MNWILCSTLWRYPLVIEGYSNANLNLVDDRSKSISGWVFTLYGAPISWGSKKQTCITHPIMESELVAVGDAEIWELKEVEWLRNLLID